MTLNVSTRELDEPDFVGDLAASISASGLAATDLVLEITERALIGDSEAVARTLLELRQLGVRIAVDDFGTGYSSLSTLQRFAVDTLKIAKPFIDDVATRTDSLADAIVRLGSTLGLGTVAEGIENDEQLRRLLHLGCGYRQGFHLCEPLAAEELKQFLSEHRRSRDQGAGIAPAA